MKIKNIEKLIISKDINSYLINNNSFKLRFYFDYIENLNKIKSLSLKIINNIISIETYALVSTYGIDKNISNEIIDSLKKRKLYNVFFKNNKHKICKYKDKYMYNFYMKLNLNILKKLNKAVIEKDHAINPFLYLDCLYFDFNNQLIIHFYDDRGMDIYCENKEKLEGIKNKYMKYLKIEFIKN